MTHDNTRHGTITLFAALVQLTGKLIAPTDASHTHIEWLQVEGRVRRNPKSFPKSSAHAPPSTKPGQHELYDGN
jgi:hypothetical protein